MKPFGRDTGMSDQGLAVKAAQEASPREFRLMLTRRRGMVIRAVLLAAVAVSATVTVERWWSHLPPPGEASDSDLFRWLVLRDLTGEPPATRQALVVRLGEALDEGIDFAQFDENLPPNRRGPFQLNVDVLLQTWLSTLASEYRIAPPGNRTGMVDRLIDRVQSWGVLDYLAGTLGESGGAASTAQWRVLSSYDARTREWVEQALPQDRDQLREFLNVVRLRILAKAFGLQSLRAAAVSRRRLEATTTIAARFNVARPRG